jgi:ketosteroid isomerase-like protein
MEESPMVVEAGRKAMTDERIQAFFDAWQAHDVDGVVSFFTSDGTYLASAGPDADGTAFRGIDEVRRGVKAFLDTYPDGRYSNTSFVIAGDRGFAQWTFSGTSRDGRAISYRGVDILEFEGDRIRLKDAYRKEKTAPIGG